MPTGLFRIRVSWLRQRGADGVGWGWKKATDVADLRAFLSGSPPYTKPKRAEYTPMDIGGGLTVYYIFNLPG